MRHYETLFIINPEINDEDTDAVVEKYTGILNDGGAFIGVIDKWGRRRLAYTVKKFNKGFYVLLDYGATPGAVAEMERLFKIDEQVIRFLTVKQADDYDVEAAKAALEAKAAKQAQAETEAAERAEARKAEAEAAEAETAKPEPEAAEPEEAAPEASSAPEAAPEEPAAEETASDEANAEETASDEANAEEADTKPQETQD
jgi:small subunit ribosomal protein S6